jgi:hypothetical protein
MMVVLLNVKGQRPSFLLQGKNTLDVTINVNLLLLQISLYCLTPLPTTIVCNICLVAQVSIFDSMPRATYWM